jgi:hypothetical protein
MTDFPSVAFQSSLSIAGILFGVFGFLYSLYGVYTSQINTQSLGLPTIAKPLKWICWFLAILLAISTLLNICSLVFMYLYSKDILGLGNIILASVFALIIAALAVVSIVAASFMT